MVQAAAEAEMPRDQIERFIIGGCVVLQSMMPFHAAAREADQEDGPDEIAMGGSRGPGKSFASLAQVGLDDCQRRDGLKFLFLRKVMKSAAESLDDLTRKVFRFTPHKATAEGVEFPNGSRIVIGGYNNARDIDKYLGLEYDGIAVEEATQLPEDKKENIRGSLRTTRSDWRARMYLTTNADGPGLLWFKKAFVIPAREHREKWTRFFNVTYKDNPFLHAEYIRWLEGLKGPRGKAWRDADWDAFAGMAFPGWDYERHVVEPHEIPDTWFKWRATDEGTTAPFCTLWAARNPNTRQVIVYREAYQPGLTLTQQAEMIKEMTPPNEVISIHYGDPAMWQRKNSAAKITSANDIYKDNKVYLTRADNDRISGKRKIDDALADLPNGEPGMVVFSTCVNLIEQLSTLAHDTINVEDVDTTAEDHAYDTCRYLFTNQKRTDTPPPAPGGQDRRSTHPGRAVKGI